MDLRGFRRSRRRSRAAALGLTLAELDRQSRTVLAPADTRRPVQPRTAGCCTVHAERHVSPGGTVMVIRHHQRTCSVWGRPEGEPAS